MLPQFFSVFICGSIGTEFVMSNLFYTVAAAVFIVAANFISKGYKSQFPPANEIHSFRESSLNDAAFIAFGMRRLNADISFISLLQYYGTPENVDEQAENAGDTSWIPDQKEHDDKDYGGGAYPEFYARSRRILDIDPHFRHAAVYSAGALAFNLNRADEAIALLEFAKSFDPKEWRYASYLAAIGYSKVNDPEKVADAMAHVVKDPECPTMVKQLIAFLNKRIKRYAAAATIYRDIIATSKEAGYVENAGRELEKLRSHGQIY